MQYDACTPEVERPGNRKRAEGDMMLEMHTLIVWAVVGGTVRILLGVSKSMTTNRSFDARMLAYNMIYVLFSGVLSALFIKADGFEIAFFAGLGGSDVLNVIYRSTIGKLTGLTPPGIGDLSLGSSSDGVMKEFEGLLNKKQAKAVDFVRRFGKITKQEYQSLNKCSESVATKELSAMVKKNVFSVKGKGKGAYYILK
jgi:hypothetical protein